jgi:hypothetical protein
LSYYFLFVTFLSLFPAGGKLTIILSACLTRRKPLELDLAQRLLYLNQGHSWVRFFHAAAAPAEASITLFTRSKNVENRVRALV